MLSRRSNSLRIFWLKKHGFLDGGLRYGGIRWTYGMSSNESSVDFTVTTNGSEGDNIRLRYTHTNRWTDEKESMDYRLELATTPCNYGGKRYWFICRITKNGKYCGKRVGVLYSTGKWFSCRHCGEIAYAVQMKGGKYRCSSLSLPDIERAEKEVKRSYYNGKLTRKYRRVIRMSEKLNRDAMMMKIHLDKRFERFAPSKK